MQFNSSISQLNSAYFEIKILQLHDQGCVAIGLAQSKFPCKGSLPGWTLNSYGYHSDDGNSFGNNKDVAYGESFKVGDVIGCGIDSSWVYFTKNGHFLGPAYFTKLQAQLLPTIGIDYPGQLQVNIQQKNEQQTWCEFMYNISNIQEEMNEALINISPINSIPLEILLFIFELSISTKQDLLTSVMVCQTWKNTLFSSASNNIWKSLSLHEWPYLCEISEPPKMRNWFRFYSSRINALKDLKATDSFKGHPIENCGLMRKKEASGIIRRPELHEDQIAKSSVINDDHLEWEFECPLLLENLVSVNLARPRWDEATSFECHVCNEVVHKVFTQKQLEEKVQQGHCVLYYVGKRDPRDSRRMMGKKRAPTKQELDAKKKKKREDVENRKKRLENIKNRGQGGPINYF